MPFEAHPYCVTPQSEDAPLWRYMDFAKFVWTLEHNALYLCRLDGLEDTFEGCLPESIVPSVVAANEEWYDPTKNFDQTLPARIVDMTRNVTFVNCWHMNAHESAAMWKLYGGALNGIAIRSTYARLKASFGGYPGRVNIGVVRYIDFRSEFANPYSAVALATPKRKSFEHEREIRVLAGPDPTDPGVDREKLERGLRTVNSLIVAVNLSKLIASVHVAPSAPAWFGDLIAAVMRRYGRDEEVIHSDLYSRPML